MVRRCWLGACALTAAVLCAAAPADALTLRQVEDQALQEVQPLAFMLLEEMYNAPATDEEIPDETTIDGEVEECRLVSRRRGSCAVYAIETQTGSWCEGVVVVRQVSGRRLLRELHVPDGCAV